MSTHGECFEENVVDIKENSAHFEWNTDALPFMPANCREEQIMRNCLSFVGDDDSDDCVHNNSTSEYHSIYSSPDTSEVTRYSKWYIADPTTSTPPPNVQPSRSTSRLSCYPNAVIADCTPIGPDECGFDEEDSQIPQERFRRLPLEPPDRENGRPLSYREQMEIVLRSTTFSPIQKAEYVATGRMIDGRLAIVRPVMVNEEGGWFTTEFADEMDGPARCVLVHGIVDSVNHLNDDFVQMRVTIDCGRAALVGLPRHVWDKNWKEAIRLGKGYEFTGHMHATANDLLISPCADATPKNIDHLYDEWEYSHDAGYVAYEDEDEDEEVVDNDDTDDGY